MTPTLRYSQPSVNANIAIFALSPDCEKRNHREMSDQDDIIDGKWISARLRVGRRGAKAELARAMGISNDKLSKILKGDRQVQPQEIPRVLRFFGHTMALVQPATSDDMGFAEPAGNTFMPGDREMFRAVCDAIAPDITHISPMISPTMADAAGILRGDLLLLDVQTVPATGDLLVANLIDKDGHSAGTTIRSWLPPWYVPTRSGDQPIHADDGLITPMGVICGVLRGAGVERMRKPIRRR